jgi:hypothetical protein
MQKLALRARFCAPRASSSRIGRGTSALGLPPEQPRYDGANDNARRASSSRAVGTGELYVPIPPANKCLGEPCVRRTVAQKSSR